MHIDHENVRTKEDEAQYSKEFKEADKRWRNEAKESDKRWFMLLEKMHMLDKDMDKLKAKN